MPVLEKPDDIFCDVLVIGDLLEAVLVAEELKRQSFSVLLVEVLDFPQLKSKNFNEEFMDVLSQNFCQLKNREKKGKNKKNMKEGEEEEKKERRKNFLKDLEDIESPFDWFSQSFQLKKEPWPFFYSARLLRHQKKKNFQGDSIKDEELVSLNFERGVLKSLLLSGGKRIFASWVIFCLSPHSFIKLKGVRKNIPARFFSRLAGFRAWSQIHLVFQHQFFSHSPELEKSVHLSYQFHTFKRSFRFSGGGFGALQEKEVENKNQGPSSQKQENTLNYPEPSPQKQTSDDQDDQKKEDLKYFIQNSHWCSLIPHEVLEEAKALHTHIQSMKKQIRSTHSSLFKDQIIKEERIFIEPESHGFLNLRFRPSFGQISGVKNLLLSSSLFSPLPPPLSAWDVSQKTLKTLSFLL